MTMITIQIVEPKKEVADDLGDFFAPDEVPDGVVAVCKGRIKTRSGPIVEAVLAYDRCLSLDGIRVVRQFEDGSWGLSTGSSVIPPSIAAAIAAVLGVVV